MQHTRLQALRLRYPHVYANTVRAECGDGWFGILDALGELLTRQAEQERRPATEIRIFKEKFGILRFGRASPNATDAVICRMATAISERVSEVCGCLGELSGAKVPCASHPMSLMPWRTRPMLAASPDRTTRYLGSEHSACVVAIRRDEFATSLVRPLLSRIPRGRSILRSGAAWPGIVGSLRSAAHSGLRR
jgi:hypothetical protein